jgi:hypothetical protein
MLPMPDGRRLLQWQVERLMPDRLIYVTRAEYRRFEEPILRNLRFTNLNASKIKVLFIEKKTNGPLDGLWAVRKHLKTREELLIAYNDELIEGKEIQSFITAARMRSADAGVVCFRNPDDRFTRIPGSDLACGCTYYFRSGMEFIRLMANNKRGPENGVPDAVYASETWLPFLLNEGEYVEIGTAREYKNWMAEQGTPVMDW